MGRGGHQHGGLRRERDADSGITDKSKLITYTWDKDSYRGEDFSKTSPSSYCKTAFSQISMLCRNVDGGKQSVQKGLSNVTCRYGGKGKFSTSMSKRSFTVVWDWEEPNMEASIQQSLQKNL